MRTWCVFRVRRLRVYSVRRAPCGTLTLAPPTSYASQSEDMQQDAVDCASQAMEKFNIEKDIAAYIKKGELGGGLWGVPDSSGLSARAPERARRAAPRSCSRFSPHAASPHAHPPRLRHDRV